MKKSEKYSHLRISVAQLVGRILNSDSPALQFNAFVEGNIIGVPVGQVNGITVYHEFERSGNQFRDLGLCTL